MGGRAGVEPAYDDDEPVDRPLDRADRRLRAAPALTNSRSAESGVAWSPDGTRLAFAAPATDGPLSPGSLNALAAMAGRPGGSSGQQIFVLDVAGGGDEALEDLRVARQYFQLMGK